MKTRPSTLSKRLRKKQKLPLLWWTISKSCKLLNSSVIFAVLSGSVVWRTKEPKETNIWSCTTVLSEAWSFLTNSAKIRIFHKKTKRLTAKSIKEVTLSILWKVSIRSSFYCSISTVFILVSSENTTFASVWSIDLSYLWTTTTKIKRRFRKRKRKKSEEKLCKG